MSEEQQIFATLGFSEERSCTRAKEIFSNLLTNNSEYKNILPELIDPENFVDLLTESDQFGTVLRAEWFGGSFLNKKTITENLLKLQPKYLAIEHHYDSGASRKTGYIDNKKTKFQTVMQVLAEESDEVGYTMALLSENTKEVKVYLDKGVHPNASHFKNQVLLHQDYGYKGPLVLALIEADASVNVQSKKIENGETPLQLAASADRADIVKALIEAGADVNLPSLKKGSFPVTHCFRQSPKGKKNLKMVLEAGANVNALDHEGYSPLLRLLSWYSPDSLLSTMKLLIKYGADLEYYHEDIGNALWLAIDNELDDCRDFLVKKGGVIRKPKARPPMPLPKNKELAQQMEFLEEHELKSNQLASEATTTGSYWPKDNKAWSKERKVVWQYIQGSIKEWFGGNVDAKSVSALKRYFLSGTELPDGLGYGSVKPLFLVWLHPCSDVQVLRKLLLDEYDYSSTRYSYFMADIPTKSPCGKIGPRNKLISKLLYEKCFKPENSNTEYLKLRSFFIKRYADYVSTFLRPSFDPYDKTAYLLNEFMGCVKEVVRGDITLVEDKPRRLFVRGKAIETTRFKYMIESVHSFTIDKMPHAKLEATTQFVEEFKVLLEKGPLKQLIETVIKEARPEDYLPIYRHTQNS